MTWLAPHKRSFTNLYRMHWWVMQGLEQKSDKTQDDKEAIVNHRIELDKLWTNMTDTQRRDLDPTIDVAARSGGKWTEMKAWLCPNCGWLHHIVASSSPPPRCSACMMDVVL